MVYFHLLWWALRVLPVYWLMLFSLRQLSLSLWWLPPLFSFTGAAIIWMLSFPRLRSCLPPLELRSLLKPKWKVLYLSKIFPYFVGKKQTKEERLVGGSGWKYSWSWPVSLSRIPPVTKTSSHMTTERSWPTPDNLVSILRFATYCWGQPHQFLDWCLLISKKKCEK